MFEELTKAEQQKILQNFQQMIVELEEIKKEVARRQVAKEADLEVWLDGQLLALAEKYEGLALYEDDDNPEIKVRLDQIDRLESELKASVGLRDEDDVSIASSFDESLPDMGRGRDRLFRDPRRAESREYVVPVLTLLNPEIYSNNSVSLRDRYDQPGQQRVEQQVCGTKVSHQLIGNQMKSTASFVRADGSFLSREAQIRVVFNMIDATMTTAMKAGKKATFDFSSLYLGEPYLLAAALAQVELYREAGQAVFIKGDEQALRKKVAESLGSPIPLLENMPEMIAARKGMPPFDGVRPVPSMAEVTIGHDAAVGEKSSSGRAQKEYKELSDRYKNQLASETEAQRTSLKENKDMVAQLRAEAAPYLSHAPQLNDFIESFERADKEVFVIKDKVQALEEKLVQERKNLEKYPKLQREERKDAEKVLGKFEDACVKARKKFDKEQGVREDADVDEEYSAAQQRYVEQDEKVQALLPQKIEADNVLKELNEHGGKLEAEISTLEKEIKEEKQNYARAVEDAIQKRQAVRHKIQEVLAKATKNHGDRVKWIERRDQGAAAVYDQYPLKKHPGIKSSLERFNAVLNATWAADLHRGDDTSVLMSQDDLFSQILAGHDDKTPFSAEEVETIIKQKTRKLSEIPREPIESHSDDDSSSRRSSLSGG
jgi:hypothetical protein